MSLPGLVPGLPGIRAPKIATHKIVFFQGDWLSDLALGKMIDGNNASDPSNSSPDQIVLQPGLLLGKLTSTTGDLNSPVLGAYGASIVDNIQSSIAASATSLTLTVAGATELVRRFGSSGTFNLIGPPAAGGTVATNVITYSAVNLTTGVVTISAAPAAYYQNSFVCPQDGSQLPLTLIPDGYGILVTDNDFATRLTVQFPQFPIAGVINPSQLIAGTTAYGSLDTSLQNWVKTNLSTATGAKFVFQDNF